MEQQFEEAWSKLTQELRAKAGSLGSRLHLGNDGFFYGYAQWPSREAREKAIFSSEMKINRSIMTSAIELALDEVVLEPVADFLIPHNIMLL